MKYVIVTIVVFCLIACEKSPKIPLKVQESLNASGNNKKELYKVIEAYSKSSSDSLKLKAAYFLIENLPSCYYFDSSLTAKHDYIFLYYDSLVNINILQNVADNGGNIVREVDERYPIVILKYNDIKQKYGTYSNLTKNQSICELNTIKSDDIINNIELAFYAWEMPWARHVDFNSFCEYILPNRVGMEPTFNWRKKVLSKFKDTIEYKKMSTTNVCITINDSLKNFVYNRLWERHTHSPEGIINLIKARGGNCAQRISYNEFVHRALGIAITKDFTPCWANRNWNHSWNVFLSESGKFQDFEAFAHKKDFWKVIKMKHSKYELDSTGQRILDKSMEGKGVRFAKVFRKTFSKPLSTFKALNQNRLPEQDIPRVFKDEYYLDVTDEYTDVVSLKYKLDKNLYFNNGFAYLSVYNNGDWYPTSWSFVDSSFNATFQKTATKIVYLPSFYKQENVTPASCPIIVDSMGVILKLIPNWENTISASLQRIHPVIKSDTVIPNHRYELFYWDDGWKSLGKKKATSNKIEFQNLPTNCLYLLYHIDRKKTDQQERIFTIKNSNQVWW